MEHKNLMGALLKAKLSMGKLLKDSKNPHFKSSYASLAAVIDTITTPLLEAGIVLVESPVPDVADGFVAIDVTLFHPESGESITYRSSGMPIAQRTPQGIGSTITYARRYHLMTVFGLAPEDDDGNAGSSNGQQRTSAQPPRAQDRPAEPVTPVTQPEPTNGNRHKPDPTISAAQMKMFHAIGKEVYGAEWDDKRTELVMFVTKQRTSSSKDLTVAEATKLLEGLRAKAAVIMSEEIGTAGMEPQDATGEDDVFDGAGPHDTEEAEAEPVF